VVCLAPHSTLKSLTLRLHARAPAVEAIGEGVFLMPEDVRCHPLRHLSVHELGRHGLADAVKHQNMQGELSLTAQGNDYPLEQVGCRPE
jgi:hypothetical protein